MRNDQMRTELQASGRTTIAYATIADLVALCMDLGLSTQAVLIVTGQAKVRDKEQS